MRSRATRFPGPSVRDKVTDLSKSLAIYRESKAAEARSMLIKALKGGIGASTLGLWVEALSVARGVVRRTSSWAKDADLATVLELQQWLDGWYTACCMGDDRE